MLALMGGLMHRAQILLEEWQYAALKALAERKRRSISDVVREILSEKLREPGAPDPGEIDSLAGLVADGDISGRDHDSYLYGSASRRKKP